MTPFTVVTGPAAQLMQPNIDTDTIIRIDRLSGQDRRELGRYALEALRFRADGSEDPDFVLNRSPFRDAPILLGGANFGCGSSREGAVWALNARGIRCVIAESFGEIFFSNCFQNGVLAIRLSADRMRRLDEVSSDGAPVTVDLFHKVIVPSRGEAMGFDVDPRRRESLLEGLDEIATTLRSEVIIRTWQASDRLVRPWAWSAVEKEQSWER